MADYVMFCRTTLQGIALLILYVDDMVITGSDPVAIAFLKRHLQFEYEMKDLGFLQYFLALKLHIPPEAIFCLKNSMLLIFLIVPS